VKDTTAPSSDPDKALPCDTTVNDPPKQLTKSASQPDTTKPVAQPGNTAGDQKNRNDRSAPRDNAAPPPRLVNPAGGQDRHNQSHGPLQTIKTPEKPKPSGSSKAHGRVPASGPSSGNGRKPGPDPTSGRVRKTTLDATSSNSNKTAVTHRGLNSHSGGGSRGGKGD
jgi:hypothetical protein